METIIKLVRETFVEDMIGQRVPMEQKRTVFATKKSITRAEFAAAGEHGLRPEITVETPAVNYKGEKYMEEDGKRYEIYRTYQPDADMIELYGGTKVGNESFN